MPDKYYKFKNVKQSVIMKLIQINNDGIYVLENKYYKGLFYKAKPEDLEEVKCKN